MKNLIEAGQKNYQSSSNLELNEARLKRKAADMLMKRLDDSRLNEDVDEFGYEERAE